MKNGSLLFIAFAFLSSSSPAQWIKQPFPSTEYLWKVRFATEQTGWVAGGQHIYKTTDGGSNWTKQDTSIGSCDAMFSLSDQIAMFSNWTGAGEKSRGIRRTTDGGLTWTTADAEKNYYTDIDFGSSTVGYASGGSTTYIPLVKKTTDAGATWSTISQNFPKAKYELTGIAFVDADIGWAVSYDGFVYNTTNGGTDWALQDSLGFNNYRDIDFVSSTMGWIVGGISGDQKFAHSTNGGQTWIKSQSGGCSIREVEFLTVNSGWYAGNNNGAPYIGKINNDGETWTTQTLSPSSNGFESIDMVNENVGYAVGGLGDFYKTTNGGVLSVHPEMINSKPSSFSLEQNFPNPFNPSTNIRFSIPSNEFVSLKVYSVTGILLDELVHQSMDAGTYSVIWDAHNIPSGVYFYTLRSGNHTQTKKLIIMK